MNQNKNITDNKKKLAGYVEIAIYLVGAIVVPALIIISGSKLGGKGGPWYVPYFFYGFAAFIFILQMRRVIRLFRALNNEAKDNV